MGNNVRAARGNVARPNFFFGAKAAASMRVFKLAMCLRVRFARAIKVGKTAVRAWIGGLIHSVTRNVGL